MAWPQASPDGRWSDARDLFLAALDHSQRSQVAQLLRQPTRGGLGLRMWLRNLAAQGGVPKGPIPATLVQIYLDDPEAVPLHDCGRCGIAVPVRPDWHGFEGEPRRVYFPTCPCCGGHTGLHAYWFGTDNR